MPFVGHKSARIPQTNNSGDNKLQIARETVQIYDLMKNEVFLHLVHLPAFLLQKWFEIL
jgi:hypothetical protein